MPEWLRRRIAALKEEVLPDSVGHYRQTITLPPQSILNSSQGADVERQIEMLQAFTRTDLNFVYRGVDVSNYQAVVGMIADLLLMDNRRLDAASSDALTSAYLDALEDLPAWSVREALRKWNRGESNPGPDGKKHDFNWSPKPPILRYLAQTELALVRQTMTQLTLLLDAVPFSRYERQDSTR